MPQNIFSIKKKGRITESYDADFVLVEQDTSYTIHEKDIVSKCNWSPYLGRKVTSKIHSTYIGGEEVYNASSQEFKKSRYIKELSYDR